MNVIKNQFLGDVKPIMTYYVPTFTQELPSPLISISTGYKVNLQIRY